MTGNDLETAARRYQECVSKRIESEGRTWHPLEYKARAEMIAQEVIPEGWEWRVFEVVGALPQVVLMSYDPRVTARE